MGSFSIWHWLIVLLVVLIFFGGGNKLKSLGSDLAGAIKGFKDGMKDGDAAAAAPASPPAPAQVAHQGSPNTQQAVVDVDAKPKA